MAEPSPTLRRRELASRLRELRVRSGLTVDDLARQLLCSAAKISRIETGKRSPTLRDVRDLCLLYGVSEAERERLMTIARESKQQGWWNRFDDLDNIESLIGLEIEAKRISSYESANLPWALQTEEYARAIIKGILPRIDDRILDERVTARIKRQELLRSPNSPYLWSLIDESAFHRAIGGNQVMREQLSKILDMVNAPNVTMQVVPFEAGAHPGLDNTFTLLEFDRSVLAPVVFIENLAGNLYLEREAEIERYREALEHLRACALSPIDSTRWVHEMKKNFEESLHTLRKVSECLTKGVFVVLSPDFSAPDISWRTAVKSGASNCVRVARRDDVIMIADSKNPGGPVLSYTVQEFDAFLDGAKKGEFDDFLN